MVTPDRQAIIDAAITTLTTRLGRRPSRNAVFDLVGGHRQDTLEYLREHPSYQGPAELDGSPAVDAEEDDALADARAHLTTAEAALAAAREDLETCRERVRLAQQHMILQHAHALDLVWKNAERDAVLQAEIAAATHRYHQCNDRLAAQHEALSQARAAVVAAEHTQAEAEQGAWLRTHHPALAAQLTAATRDYQEAATPGSRIMYKAIIRERTAEANALWVARVTG